MKKTMDKKLEAMFRNPVQKKHVEVVRLQMVQEGRSLYGAKKIMTPEDAVELIRPLFELADREMVAVISLNVQGEAVAAEIAAIGAVESCEVCIKNLFKTAILSNSSMILLCHNHPTGKLEPSNADILLTARVGEAGDYLDVLLLDHIIMGEEGYYSFRESYEGGAFWTSRLEKKKRGKKEEQRWNGHY